MSLSINHIWVGTLGRLLSHVSRGETGDINQVAQNSGKSKRRGNSVTVESYSFKMEGLEDCKWHCSLAPLIPRTTAEPPPIRVWNCHWKSFTIMSNKDNECWALRGAKVTLIPDLAHLTKFCCLISNDFIPLKHLMSSKPRYENRSEVVNSIYKRSSLLCVSSLWYLNTSISRLSTRYYLKRYNLTLKGWRVLRCSFTNNYHWYLNISLLWLSSGSSLTHGKLQLEIEGVAPFREHLWPC